MMNRREVLKLGVAPFVGAALPLAAASGASAVTPTAVPLDAPLDSLDDLAAAMQRLRALDAEILALPLVQETAKFRKQVSDARATGRWRQIVEDMAMKALAPISRVRPDHQWNGVWSGHVWLNIAAGTSGCGVHGENWGPSLPGHWDYISPGPDEAFDSPARLRPLAESLLAVMPREALVACLRLQIGFCRFGESLFLRGAFDDDQRRVESNPLCW
jgi:hypothetical protein